MIRTMRGTAMAETAIVLTVALLVIFGIMQIGIWGYNQATMEGAAFIAAHSASINSSGSQATDQTYGLSVANLAFPTVTGNQLTLSYPTTNSIQVLVQKPSAGFPINLGKVPGQVTVRGGDIEPILANKADTTSTNTGFAAQASLVNYCYFQNKTKTACSTRSIYLAQYDDIYGKGNGKNGQFAEWNCRPNYFPAYPSTYFPATIPVNGVNGYTTGYNSQYDPGSNNFGGGNNTTESNLYSFDTQPSKWGTQSSC